ncbi:MAG TPA: hypothetical protein DCP71_06645, partial [Verrucomicrobiales bacterium]|nr:hypothetical protein [Verrucomicrobiales bacterium]
LTLEQRSSKRVLRLATEWPPTVPAGMGVKPGGRDAMMQAWTVRPQILNDVVAPGGVLKRVENTHWREIFSAGWTRLMATWEPNLEAKAVLLFHLQPGAQQQRNPFPLLQAQTRFRHGGKNVRQPDLQMRLVAMPPDASMKGEGWKMMFPAMRSHADEVLACKTNLVNLEAQQDAGLVSQFQTGSLGTAGRTRPWLLKMELKTQSVTPSLAPYRIGGLDLGFGGKLSGAKGADEKNGGKDGKIQANCFFVLRYAALADEQWNNYVPLQLVCWGVGYEYESTGPKERPMEIPLQRVAPGGTDPQASETPLFSEEGGQLVAEAHPFILPLPLLTGYETDKEKKEAEKQRQEAETAKKANVVEEALLKLEISQVQGLTFTESVRLAIHQTEKTPNAETLKNMRQRLEARLWYLDRTPFFNCVLDTRGEPEVVLEESKAGSEWLYYSSKGADRGWQRRAASGVFLMVLPPQGIGEAMEKGRQEDGYRDIEEKQRVDFRFCGSTLLFIEASDRERNYQPLPWNIRSILNGERTNGLVGLPLRMASFEMLYGLRFTVDRVPYLRVAELMARMGSPRRPLGYTPVHDGNPYLLASGEDSPDYNQQKKWWHRLLQCMDSRLAVYEVFDDRQMEFKDTGELGGLVVEGGRNGTKVTAELRKAAQLRTSMPAVADGAAQPGDFILLKPEPMPEPVPDFDKLKGKARADAEAAAKKKYQEEEAKKEKTEDKLNRLAGIIPNYEDGLAGSFAWAFESRLIYEMLWQDPMKGSWAVVESVEASVARLYFSALGGWGTQKATFANGRLTIAVAVEMGRVSELRVEVLGRINTMKNRAKLVTVFRRTVLPNKQFVAQQDRHEGRPLLRKTEEYVEFIEQYRLLQDLATVDVNAGLPGCVKACSCHERVLVDSRWGQDMYNSNQQGLGWKVPLRKADANPRIYGPANVLLHCHTHGKAEGDCAGRIENLDNLWFYTLTDENLTDDTDQWPDVRGLDLRPRPKRDDEKDAKDGAAELPPKPVRNPNLPRPFGAPAVPPDAARMTYRLSGMTMEANLSHHLPPDPTVPPDQQRSVGSVLRYVTLFRLDPGPNQSDIMAGAGAKLRRDMAEATDLVQGHVESTLAVLEQFTTRRSSEAVLGWKLGGALNGLDANVLDALKPAAAMAKQLDVQVDALQHFLRKEAGHLVTNVSEWMESFKTEGINKAVEGAREASNAKKFLQKAVEKIQGQLEAGVTSFYNGVRQPLKDAVTAARGLEKKTSEFVDLIKAKLKVISAAAKGLTEGGQNMADTDEWKQMELLVPSQIREFLDGGLETVSREILGYAVGLCVAKMPPEKVGEYLGRVAEALVKENEDGLVKAWLKARQVTANVKNLPSAFVRVLAGKSDAGFDYRLEEALNTGLEDTVAKFKAKAAALDRLLKSDLATAEERLRTQILTWLDKVTRWSEKEFDGIVWENRVEPLETHLEELGQEVLRHGHDLTEKVDRLCTEVSRAVAILPEEGQKIEAALKKTQAWVGEQKKEAEKAWEDVVTKLETDVDSPLKKMKDAVAALQVPQDIVILTAQLEKQLVTNVTDVLKRADRDVRGIATQVNEVLQDPLQQLRKLKEPDDQVLVDALKAEIKKRITVMTDAWWGKTLESIHGTAEHGKAVLEEGQEGLVKLQELFVNSWPFPAAVTAPVTEKAMRHALAEVRRVIIHAEKLEQLLRLPWLRSLPNPLDASILLSQLKKLEWALEAAQEKVDFGKMRNDLKKSTDNLVKSVQDALKIGVLKIPTTFEDLKKELITKLDSLVGTQGKLNDNLKDLEAFCLSLEDKLAAQIKNEAEKLSKALNGEFKKLVKDASSLVTDDLKAGLNEGLANLPGIEFFERGLPEAQAWFDLQRQTFQSQMDGLASVKEEFVEAAGGAGKAAAELFRTFGRVPDVPGLDFNDIVSFGKGTIDEGVANFSNRMRNIGCEFMQDVGAYVRMSPVTAMVDRTRNALNEVAEEARLKAASLEMGVRDVRRRLEADVTRLKEKALKDLLPDFGAIKLEKLLGAAGVSEKFAQDLKARSKLSHGFDQQTLSAWVDSQVEDLELTDSLTLFSLGPVALNLKKAKLNSSLRILTNAKGETEKNGQGSIVADWEVCMGGQPLMTYAQAKLECINGQVKMELDPQKVRMPSMLQMLADTMAAYSYKDDAGLVAGVRLDLPKEVTGFATFNLDFPPIGAGTTSIQNLRLSLFFELSLTFPRFPSLTDAGLRISAGAALSDKSAPFIIAIFILGGCGWFRMRLDYVVPFKDGSPYLQAEIDVALGASASLCLNLGFASGQVFIALAVELQCFVSRGRSQLRFSFV